MKHIYRFQLKNFKYERRVKIKLKVNEPVKISATISVNQGKKNAKAKANLGKFEDV